MMNELKKLKRVVIKEELVELTGDFKLAIVLQQMLYWSDKVKDYDKFLQDEIKRSKMAMGEEEITNAEKLQEVDLFSHGWIYKSAAELSEETMIGASKTTMGKYLEELVNKGWLDKRKNPKWKGDNTFQYRVNLFKIQKDLYQLGYCLEGYPLLITQSKNETSKSSNWTWESKKLTTRQETGLPVKKLDYITRDYSEITQKNIDDEEDKLTENEFFSPNEDFSLLCKKYSLPYRLRKQILERVNSEGLSIKEFYYDVLEDTFKQILEDIKNKKKISSLPGYFVSVLTDKQDRLQLEKMNLENKGEFPFFNWLED
jgi:predicted transcriptional regulator